MATLPTNTQPQDKDNGMDSDNDTQMSQQDNNNDSNTNKNSNNNDNSTSNNNPAVNIDNAANNNSNNNNKTNNTNDDDSNMNDNTNNNTNNDNQQQNQGQGQDDDGDATVDDNSNTNSNNNNGNGNGNNDQQSQQQQPQQNPNNNGNGNGNGNDDNKQNDQQQQSAQGQQPAQPQGPQYKYVWQWLENDGSWKPYDATTQLLLDQLGIGQKISIQAGKWTYDITKTSNDACSQLNTQTNKSRQSRRARVLIVPPAATQNNNNGNNNGNTANTNNNNGNNTIPAQNGSNPWIGNGRYTNMWQFLENDSKWKDLGYNVAVILEQLPLNGTAKYSFGQYSYTVQKITNDECTQTNDSTNNQRDLRRILWDTVNNKRPVWQFNDDKGGWTALDNNDLMLKLINLPIGQNTNHTRGQWTYQITKVDATHATQKNTSTNKVRQYRMVEKDKDEMDPNWASKASTNNQNYSVGYASAYSQQNQQYYGGYNFGGLFAHMAARGMGQDDDDDKPKEIIKLDPNDVQDIIMADDLAALNAQDLAQSNDDNKSRNKNKNKSGSKAKGKSGSRKNSRSKLRGLFGKKKKGNNDNDAPDDEDEEDMNGGDNDDNDDIKEDDTGNKSEKVLMGDDDRKIFTEFTKTMTLDSVQVHSIQKIKDNAAKTIVYNALLTAKKEELKDKAVDKDKIERVLFHGTSFANIAKIVNNGFNRDFNRHHLYGKGTYFSSLASESAKYCENDDEADKDKYVMLVCRVIIGEFTKGTQQMDGSSIPYKPDKKTQYESCVNNIKAPTIFVINRDYHAIPTHIITFKYKK